MKILISWFIGSIIINIIIDGILFLIWHRIAHGKRDQYKKDTRPDLRLIRWEYLNEKEDKEFIEKYEEN